VKGAGRGEAKNWVTRSEPLYFRRDGRNLTCKKQRILDQKKRLDYERETLVFWGKQRRDRLRKGGRGLQESEEGGHLNSII